MRVVQPNIFIHRYTELKTCSGIINCKIINFFWGKIYKQAN